jgi:parallel beta-helix repeat protein
MKRATPFFITLVALAMMVLNGCAPRPTPMATLEIPSPTPALPTTAAAPATLTPVPQGRTIQVTSTADGGPGTLRQAMLEAQNGDTITFDPAVFPPDHPASIAVTNELPWLSQGDVTIDASNAGVILEGSVAGGEWTPGLTIDSEGNTIQGLQIVHFTGAGIVLREHAVHNIIGGDPTTGSSPLGEGNLISDNSDGIAVFGASSNTILGNLIGTEPSGNNPWPNRGAGVFLQDGARGNVIGPNNVIAYHNDTGIDIRSGDSTGNTFTQNSIHDNLPEGIRLPAEAGEAPIPPVIFDFDLQAGIVEGRHLPILRGRGFFG